MPRLAIDEKAIARTKAKFLARRRSSGIQLLNLEGHDVFLTVGTTLTAPGVLLPSLGREWISVFPPVVADYCAPKTGRLPKSAMDARRTLVRLPSARMGRPPIRRKA
jgi:hypothetical protein